jgi:hypothetical protein
MKILLLFSLLLISCGSNKDTEDDKDTKKTKGPDQIIVGRIASFSKSGKFVLIQKFGTGTLPKGIIYQSRGPDGRTASLRPSGERVRDFFAADLVSGEVEKGDAVIAYQNQDKKEEAKDDEIEPEEENEGESEEKAEDAGVSEEVQDPQTIRDPD